MNKVVPGDKLYEIRSFFDSIAARYDSINRVLSWNLDHSWRVKTLKYVLEGQERSILDLGTGTGKLIKFFLEKRGWERAVAVDFSFEMLLQAKRNLPGYVSLVSADFHALPFENQSFDLVISGFALRSVQQLSVFFKEVERILQPGGKVALLCLTRPRNFLMRFLVYPYLKYGLPFLGGWMSGQKNAYRFLSDTILSFQTPEATKAMLNHHGFNHTKTFPFSGGLATLIVALKKETP